jgi:hypothetical protein
MKTRNPERKEEIEGKNERGREKRRKGEDVIIKEARGNNVSFVL